MPDFWLIEWGGSDTLAKRDIWPDGDAPENPTDEDVMAAMRKSGSLWMLAQEWNLDLQGVEVNGKNVDFSLPVRDSEAER